MFLCFLLVPIESNTALGSQRELTSLYRSIETLIQRANNHLGWSEGSGLAWKVPGTLGGLVTLL